MKTNWGVNNKLLETLQEHVNEIVAKEFREDAMYILTNCTDKTIREFLHFTLLENYNLACTCLDFAVNKETGEPITTKTFGHFLSDETLDELFKEPDPEDFINEDFDDGERASLEDLENFYKTEEELLIELEEWNHTCGDGCCFTYGTNIYVNGKQIEDEDGTNPHQLLKAVLNKLGYKNVIVEYKYDGE
jgi:hypothetical protein